MAARRTTLALFIALTALGSLAGPTRHARAEGGAIAAKREAGEHFQKGVSFFHDGDYQSALIEFRRAHELSPNYRVLYNLGQTSRKIKDYADALASFERYLAEGGGAIGAKRRREVERSIAQLRTKVAEVRVEVGVEGAEISVDDVAVGAAPLPGPLTMNAGRRKVAARQVGYVSTHRFIEVVGADRVSVELELLPLPTVPVEAPPLAPKAVVVAPPPPLRRERSVWPWVGLAGTGALAVTAGALSLQSFRAQASFEDTLRQRTSTNEVSDERSNVKAWALAADVVGGLAVAGAVTTIVLFVVDRSTPAGAAKARVGFDPGGLRVVF